MLILNLIQFNSYLFTCYLNNPEANYKMNTNKDKKQDTHKQNRETRQFISYK
jgi:hypothetical protein